MSQAKRTTGNDRGLQINPSPLLAMKYCSNCGITSSFIVNSYRETLLLVVMLEMEYLITYNKLFPKY